MRFVQIDLSLSEHPWGTDLAGEFDFEEAARFILFAWNGQTLAWAKSSGSDLGTKLNICYHPCRGNDVQLLASIGSTISTSLHVNTSQVPVKKVECRAELSVPSVLYETLDHGLGLLALPQGMTKSRRKRLWHIRPDALTPQLRLFEQAYGRHGLFSGHPFS